MFEKTDAEEKLERARRRFDDWIASLPNYDDDRVDIKAVHAAQGNILKKLSSPEDRDELFLFLLSFTDHLAKLHFFRIGGEVVVGQEIKAKD